MVSIPLVLTSRPIKGKSFSLNTLVYGGSEKHFEKFRSRYWRRLYLHKRSGIKLMVLLSLGYDYDGIKYEFEKNYYVN